MAASKLCGYSYHCRWRMKLQLFLRRSNVITNKHTGPLRRALFTLPLDYLCGRRCHRRYLSGSVLTAVRRRSRYWPKLKIQLRLRPASVPRIAIVHSDPRGSRSACIKPLAEPTAGTNNIRATVSSIFFRCRHEFN
jgi:hypothetical protein